MQSYTKFLDGLEKVLKILIFAVFAVMLLSMVYLVFRRYVIHNAPSWCEELARFGFFYLVFLASPLAIRRGTHLQIDFITSKYPPRVKNIVAIASNIFGAAFLSYLCYLAYTLCTTVTTISGAMRLPMKYVYIAIPIGCVLMILFSLEQVFENIISLHKGSKGEETTT